MIPNSISSHSLRVRYRDFWCTYLWNGVQTTRSLNVIWNINRFRRTQLQPLPPATGDIRIIPPQVDYHTKPCRTCEKLCFGGISTIWTVPIYVEFYMAKYQPEKGFRCWHGLKKVGAILFLSLLQDMQTPHIFAQNLVRSCNLTLLFSRRVMKGASTVSQTKYIKRICICIPSVLYYFMSLFYMTIFIVPAWQKAIGNLCRWIQVSFLIIFILVYQTCFFWRVVLLKLARTGSAWRETVDYVDLVFRVQSHLYATSLNYATIRIFPTCLWHGSEIEDQMALPRAHPSCWQQGLPGGCASFLRQSSKSLGRH